MKISQIESLNIDLLSNGLPTLTPNIGCYLVEAAKYADEQEPQ